MTCLSERASTKAEQLLISIKQPGAIKCRQRAGAMLEGVKCCEVSKLAWSLAVNQEIAGSNPALTAIVNHAVHICEMVSVDSTGRAPGCGPGS